MKEERYRCTGSSNKHIVEATELISALLTEVAMGKTKVDPQELTDLISLVKAIKRLSEYGNTTSSEDRQEGESDIVILHQVFSGAGCSPTIKLKADNPSVLCCMIETKGASCKPSITV